ncbi:MAG: hypothetical protein L3J52_03435 [Proteobacteria bacterium]|nr:hypothetical protein [Pseudomonadota bacterium]
MKFIKIMLISLAVSGVALANNVEDFDPGEAIANTPVNPSGYQIPTIQGSDVLYDNGPLVNSPGTGAGGLDESVLQNVSLGMTTLGVAHQDTGAFRIADDFTVGGSGWDITTITFFAYQTGETASTINAINLQIWDGVPGDVGSTVVFGDDSTNVMSSTINSNILRVSEASTGTATDRQIAASFVDVNISLPAGTYWLDWQSGGSGGSGPWAPPITINGQTTTGNGLQSPDSGVTWPAAVDGGTDTQQGFPFIIEGTPAIAAVIPVFSWVGIALLLLLVGFASRKYIKQ